ncbi:iron ABC transporter permease [Devriesea agamarum]|uniref:iron ABC transporter permease n=1 Tax=Devriesea agamarum TaxID=472569 RepID=UPI00071D6384|nr:iron ABC transporter permease [Devriesea agamarum]
MSAAAAANLTNPSDSIRSAGLTQCSSPVRPTGGQTGRPDHHPARRNHHPARRRGELIPFVLVVALLTLAIIPLSIVHLSQGTSDLGWNDVVQTLTGTADAQTSTIITTTRVPRLLAGIIVGAMLGLSGALLQSLSRNPLASADTLAINAGAYFCLTVAAVAGFGVGTLGGTILAFGGGMAAALIVMMLARGARDPLRLVLGGTVLTMGLTSLTGLLILLNTERTTGLYAWASGTLSQSSMGPLARITPLAIVVAAVIFLLSRQLDVLSLGEDAARTLGVRVGLLRSISVVCAVLLAAAAVSVVGPLGFVSLVAPVVARLLAPRLRMLRLTAPLFIVSALLGTLISIGADVGLRAGLGAMGALEVPTGVATSLIGAVVMVVLAVVLGRARPVGLDSAALLASRGLPTNRWWGPRRTVALGIALAVVAILIAVLLGDAKLLLGDVVNWLRGQASGRIELILDSRWPRVGVSALAGGLLALSGALVQATTRNPLADPSLLGVSAAAGTGAITSLILVPSAGFSGVITGALIGAAIAAAIVLGLGVSGGGDGSTRLVLVGLGVGTAALSITTLIIVGTDPWDQAKALTWLSGSSYGASGIRVIVAAVVLAIGVAVAFGIARALDLVQLDPTTPRVLGVRVGALRWVTLVLAVVLAATATAVVGVISFVGLVAPHAARMLVGPRHRPLLILATALGALLVVVADVIGRTVIAPMQLPAGTTTAVIGAPYFLYLLVRLNRAGRKG